MLFFFFCITVVATKQIQNTYKQTTTVNTHIHTRKHKHTQTHANTAEEIMYDRFDIEYFNSLLVLDLTVAIFYLIFILWQSIHVVFRYWVSFRNSMTSFEISFQKVLFICLCYAITIVSIVVIQILYFYYAWILLVINKISFFFFVALVFLLHFCCYFRGGMEISVS